MIQTHEITLYADAKTNFIHLNAKQYDKNSHRIVCKLSDCTNEFTAEDTAKASAYINGKTVDVINCSLNATTQKITFILSQNCLYLQLKKNILIGTKNELLKNSQRELL